MRKLQHSSWFFLSVLFLVLGTAPAWGQDDYGASDAKPDIVLPKLAAQLSADGLAATDAVPVLVLVADPNPQAQGLRSAGRSADELLAAPEAALSSFSITYVPAGQQDPWGQVCSSFPDDAKAAFQAAAAIWQNKLRSSVPITIRACWANLESSSVLGYSGGQPSYRNFSGAPKANTWYQQSLANALAGTKLGSNFDMHITYNSEFAWYLGTDGNTPYGKYDLVTVAAHEIAHGLNFSGSAQYSAGAGAYGFGTGYPTVFDSFVQSGAGTPLTSYGNPSSALGSLLTSGNLWFSGANANAANGGSRVKLYAPSTWSDGSSFSHLDYSSYASTANRMMVYSIASASAIHDPGPVTMGIMKDLGWPTEAGFAWSGTVRSGSATGPALAGATVAIAGKTATTSSTGSFSITGIPAGSYSLVISKTGYYTKTMTGIAVSADRSGLVLYLTPAPTYSWSGTVRSGSATGPVLAGATVSIGGRSALSSSTGSFNITGIPAGSYSLAISKPGYYTKTMTGIAVNANRSALVFYLTPAPTFTWSGTVRQGSASGPLLAGATVSIAGKSALSTTTGSYSITGIPAGSYSLVISKPGYYTKTLTGIAVNANRSGLVLCLSAVPAYSMSGTVRSGSATGPALAGATVSIAGQTATTSSAGTFALAGIPAGSYTLTISKSGYSTKSVAGYPVNGNQSSLVFFLAPATSYGAIRVMNRSGTLAIKELFISPSASPYWGPNQTPAPIPPGYALNVTLVPPDDYDLKAVFSNDSSYVTMNFRVLAGMTTLIDAVPGGSGAVQLLKPAQDQPGSGAQVPMRQGSGGKAKR